ncbi:TRAP transporter small permease subunit [Aliikangiella coralliicola]|uniref:TRAP transporter small permease protein n=1 Tax=Aliikangiella coralliicola TaxID=2592383 RepID=A0A545UFZ5_9GAMM|nr:TRAP transporter small permease subunit [Aliikangiella coralliicola]TQV88313.1 TRAP transporter small permease subunit [Aliikangiella coralliicola]
MKSLLSKIFYQLSNITVITGQLVSWLTVAMVVLLTLNILASWLFKSSSILVSESITWMHSANFLLAAAYTLNRNEHVRVDIFYAKMSVRAKALVDLLGTLLLLLPVSLFIIWASWSYVSLSWRIGEVSAEAGGMPATYILKGFLIVMPLLLVLEGISQLYRNFCLFTGENNIQDKTGVQ